MKYAAIFLDRDGTIIQDAGYIRHPREVEFIPGCFEALLALQERYKLFIITNQSGISKGLTTEAEVQMVNNYIVDCLRSRGILINHVFSCPHSNEDKCSCKKPGTYFIDEAAALYNLDIKSSYIIGDHPSDVECGINAGMTPVYVLTGHGEKHLNELKNKVEISKDILEASNSIK